MMNVGNNTVNFVNNIITSYPSRFSLGAGFVGGVAALEMFIRIFKDIKDCRDGEEMGPKNLSKDIGGTLFYGLLAANIVPYTAIAGASIFVIYSLLRGDPKDYPDAYLTSKAIHKSVTTVFNFVKDHIISPIAEHVLWPLCKKIGEVIEFVFNNFVWPIASGIVSLLSKIQLPKEPIWYGVAAVITLIAGYYFIPILLAAPAAMV